MTNYYNLHCVAHELQQVADKLRRSGQFKEEVNIIQCNVDWLDQECLNNNTCPFCGGSLDVIEKNHEDFHSYFSMFIIMWMFLFQI